MLKDMYEPTDVKATETSECKSCVWYGEIDSGGFTVCDLCSRNYDKTFLPISDE